MAEAHIIRRDLSRRKTLPAAPVALAVAAAALDPLARLRRGRLAPRQAPRRLPETSDGRRSFLNPVASGVAPKGAKTGSGVLVAPAPVAPDDAGAFNQSRSRPP